MNNIIKLFEGWNKKKITDAICECGIDKTKADLLIDKFDPSYFRYHNDEQKSLRFVGTFSVSEGKNEYCFYCFPKYMADTDVDISEMPLIIKAIELAQLTPAIPENAAFDPFVLNSQKSHMLRSELAEWLVNDYLCNGIINLKTKQTSLRDRGRTNWGKTISKFLPITDGRNFIYPKQLHSYYDTNEELLLSKIHCCVIAEAASFLKNSGDESINIPEHDVSLLRTLKQYVGFIQKTLNNLYEDRQIHAARAIMAWCSKYSEFYNKPIGTVSFELVWERCLRYVFDNVSEDRIKGDFTFDKPEYHLIDNNGKDNTYTLNSNGIPDIIYINKAKNNFMLLDAKYYLGRIQDGKIVEMPMYKDISKQMYYFDMLCSYGLGAENSINAFVFPKHKICDGIEWTNNDLDKGYKFIGYVKYADEQSNLLNQKFGLNKQSGTKDSILLIQIDPNSLFKLAVSNKNQDIKYINDFCEYLNTKVIHNTPEKAEIPQSDASVEEAMKA